MRGYSLNVSGQVEATVGHLGRQESVTYRPPRRLKLGAEPHSSQPLQLTSTCEISTARNAIIYLGSARRLAGWSHWVWVIPMLLVLRGLEAGRNELLPSAMAKVLGRVENPPALEAQALGLHTLSSAHVPQGESSSGPGHAFLLLQEERSPGRGPGCRAE